MRNKVPSDQVARPTGRWSRSLIAGLVLAMAASVGLGVPHASAKGPAEVTATSVLVGQATQITVKNCEDSTSDLQGIYYEISLNGEEVAKGIVNEPDFTVEWTVVQDGRYTVHVTCIGYANLNNQTAITEFSGFLAPDPIRVVSGSLGGGPVSLMAGGFLPGDLVTLTYRSPVSGTLTWEETAPVDSQGRWSYTATLPPCGATSGCSITVQAFKTDVELTRTFGGSTIGLPNTGD